MDLTNFKELHYEYILWEKAKQEIDLKNWSGYVINKIGFVTANNKKIFQLWDL